MSGKAHGMCSAGRTGDAASAEGYMGLADDAFAKS